MAQGIRKFLGGLGLVVAAGLVTTPAVAATTGAYQLEEKGLYKVLPDVTLVDAAGVARRLPEWSRQLPLLLTFAYSRCTGVCSPLLRNLDATTRQVGGVGKAYQVVVVDLDPADRPAMLAGLAHLEGIRDEGWSFTTATPDEVEALTRAVGAWARPVGGGQLDHPPMVAAVRNGRLVQAVAGADFTAERLAVAVAEARGAFVPVYPAPGSNVRLRCFRYQPDAAGFGLDWGFALLMIPAVFTLGTTALIFGRRRNG